MKKYQKQKCMKCLKKQQQDGLNRKKETIEKGIVYYQNVEENSFFSFILSKNVVFFLLHFSSF